MSWTHAELETVKTLWAAGKTASAIAMQLRGRTRNAVMGKVHREGYTRDADDGAVIKRRTKPRSRDNTRTPRMAYVPPPINVEPLFPDFVELHDCPLGAVEGVRSLTQDQCKFPIGDPRNSDFHFCGGTQKAGSSYCEHHHSIAYEVRVKRTRPSEGGAYVKNGLDFRVGSYA